LSRNTTDLLVIARRHAASWAGIRSLAEPFLDTTSDFAEIMFAILGVAAKLERRRILAHRARPGRCQSQRRQKRPVSASKLANAAQRRPQL
jgi:DNA invertase Pin-like site-specific DNA recombinase